MLGSGVQGMLASIAGTTAAGTTQRFAVWDSGNGKASWPVNGGLQLTNEAGTAGVRLDVGIVNGALTIEDTAGAFVGGVLAAYYRDPSSNVSMTGATLTGGSAYAINFTPTNGVGVADVGIARGSVGLLKITDGSSGSGSISIAAATPALATSAGVTGTLAWDATHIYVCVATNTWVRALMTTF